MIKIVCISDTHCQLDKVKLPKGDILVHAGDALSRGTFNEFTEFMGHMEQIKDDYKHVIYVPGNHDRITEINEFIVKQECKSKDIIYLNDTGIELEEIKFWGSGVTPRFHNWAWNRDSGTSGTSYRKDHIDYDPIQKHWDLIPKDTEILITHGPPKGYLDKSVYDGKQCGCEYLLKKIKKINPKYHIFGHIHYYGGQVDFLNKNTTLVNAAVCNEQYQPKNKIVVLEY